MKVVLTPMLSMCPNGKHPCKKLIPVHPESIASSDFKGKKIYDRRVKSSTLKAYDTPDNPIYMRQIDSSQLYSCTGGILVNKWSVIQPPAVSYPPMPPVMKLLLFWNANPVLPYMYPGGAPYKPHYC